MQTGATPRTGTLLPLGFFLGPSGSVGLDFHLSPGTSIRPVCGKMAGRSWRTLKLSSQRLDYGRSVPGVFRLRREIRKIDLVIVVLVGLVMAKMGYVEDYCCCV